MSGQVAQLDQGPYRGGSPASKVGAKAPGGPLICKKKNSAVTCKIGASLSKIKNH